MSNDNAIKLLDSVYNTDTSPDAERLIKDLCNYFSSDNIKGFAEFVEEEYDLVEYDDNDNNNTEDNETETEES